MFRLNPSAKQLQKKITGGQIEEEKVIAATAGIS